jgi:hypothetical protein
VVFFWGKPREVLSLRCAPTEKLLERRDRDRREDSKLDWCEPGCGPLYLKASFAEADEQVFDHIRLPPDR